MSMPALLLRRLRIGRRRLANNIDNRFRKARPGSVLILVVALLVLMALMGTAYISTTRVDRGSSAQNSFNTEIDLLIEGLCKIEQQQILTSKGATTDAYDQSSTAGASDAMLWTSPQVDSSSGLATTFLSARVPTASPSSSTTPIWPYLSAAPLGAQFESPYVPNGTTTPFTYKTNTNLQPSSITVQLASGPVVFPALYDSTSGNTYLAGSSSGSGIADSGLFRLPVGELNGVTYYGSTFTIDNSAAVNASIASQPNTVVAYQPSSTNSPLPGDFFPTSIDLSGMLRTGSSSVSQQMSQLNAYRWGGAAAASLSPFYDDGTPMSYSFNSPLEAMWMQLGRRLDNPGLNGVATGPYYQTLPVGESMAMAYRYCLMNSAASPSLLEQYLSPSVTFTVTSAGTTIPVHSSAYSPDQWSQWFTDNFVYENGGGNIRPLLVARNQVSNVSGSRFTYRATSQTPPNNNWQLSTSQAPVSYKFGDWVTGDPGTNGHTFVCIQDNTSAATNSPTATNEQFWTQVPWSDYPVKTSVNTGTFGQLWIAYWSVMSATTPDTPDTASSTTIFRNPIRAAVNTTTSSTTQPTGPNVVTLSPTGGDDGPYILAQANAAAPGATIFFTAGTYQVNERIVLPGNRIYSGGGSTGGMAALTPPEVLRLRSALAAMNTQQLRSATSDILSRQIEIPGATQGTSTAPGGAVINGPDSNTASFDFDTVDNVEVTGLTFTGTFLQLHNCQVNIHGNTFQNTGRNGIYGDDNITDSHIDNNTFTGQTDTSMMLYPGSNNTFDGNSFNQINEAIHTVGGSSNDYSSNVINYCARNGIEIQGGTGEDNLTINNNWIGNWNPNGNKQPDGTCSHMAISCATGSNPNGGAVTNQGENNTISGNTLLLNGSPGQTPPMGGNYALTGIELMGQQNINVTGNYCGGASMFIMNGTSNNAGNSNGNTLVVSVRYLPDACPWQITPLNGTDNVYAWNDPNAPAAPPAPTVPTSSSTTQPASGGTLTYRVTLYGTGQQPYITEVYANNDQSTGGGFVAVSMYNPYNTPINLTGWQWVTVNRANGISQLTFTPLDPNNSSLGISTIAPYQRLVFASTAPGNMPTGITVDSGATYVPAPALTNALNQELVLVRPHSASGTPSYSSAANDQWDETGTQHLPNAAVNPLADFVPVDSYDFTGLPHPSSTSTEWHYVRPSDQATHNWYFVYPYTYDKTTTDNTSPNAVAAAALSLPTSRLFATMVQPGATPTPTALGAAGTAPADSTYATKGLPIQINNTDFGGPKGAAPIQSYPFGGFARNGDILQTTFIGAYRIDIVSLLADGTVDPTVPAKTVEYQPVTMDSAFADDMNDNDNLAENVGRFCPMSPADTPLASTATPPYLFNDFDASGPSSPYHFAMRLYDFLTVGGPADDYMQGVRAQDNSLLYGIANVKPGIINAYSTSMPTTEDAAPMDGLININTASWRVLATLPLANYSTSSPDNINLAKAIVQYRDVDNGTPSHTPHGPFKSIFELNGVPGFRTTLYSTASNGFDPNRLTPGYGLSGLDNGPTDGDLAPLNAAAPYDQVPGDFEKQFLAFNRVSNLVTVRSDSFTTYVLVQGWRNAGTATPELVVQRRAAFTSDRSVSIPSNKVLNVTNIPVN